MYHRIIQVKVASRKDNFMKQKFTSFFVCAALFALLCSCSTEPDTRVSCDLCGEKVLAEYASHNDKGETLCPECFQRIFVDTDIYRCPVCKEVYNSFYSEFFGYCQDCGDIWLSPCSFCGEYTEKWHDDFSLCTHCARQISYDQECIDTLRRLFDGE